MKLPYKVAAFDLFNTVFDPASLSESNARVYIDQLRNWRATGVYQPVHVPRSFNTMKPFADSAEAIGRLQAAGVICVAASNIPAETVRAMSRNAGIVWNNIVDFGKVKVLKPSLLAYMQICIATGCAASDIVMVTNNPGSGDDVEPLKIGMQTHVINRKGGNPGLEELVNSILNQQPARSPV